MEYQGIITGIGDKALGKNLIMPELDAYINKFIIGKNTIIEGLNLNFNTKTISAGACILCGFRGIIEESQTFDTYDQNTYIYGKFVLYFDKDIQDEFYIETTTTQKTGTNVNPTKITEAGIYYLWLYHGTTINPDLDTTYPYPVNAQRSIETDLVKDNAEIESEVLGFTQPKNDNSRRIATTEYVHRQIEEEIAYQRQEIKKTLTSVSVNNPATVTFNFAVKVKAKFVLLENGGTISFSGGNINFFGETTIDTLKEGLRPKEDIIIGLLSVQDVVSPTNGTIIIKTDGRVVFTATIGSRGKGSFIPNIGYECQ